MKKCNRDVFIDNYIQFDKNADWAIDYLMDCFQIEIDGSITWKARPLNHFKTIRAYRRYMNKYCGERIDKNRKPKWVRIGLSTTRIYVDDIRHILKHGDWPKESGRNTGRPKNIIKIIPAIPDISTADKLIARAFPRALKEAPQCLIWS